MTEEELSEFMEYVNIDGPVPDVCPELGPCWLWLGRITSKGYGYYYVKQGWPFSAHRLMGDHVFGPLQQGFATHHLCEVRRCVNPQHLRRMLREDHIQLHARLNYHK
jgi:hypothetical protein